MIFRQLYDSASGTYSYLLASRKGAEALIIDPVLEKVDRYIQLMNDLDLRLVKAVDTHLHADHVTGLGALRDRTRCVTVMGENTKADVVSLRLADGDKLDIEGVSLDVIYTPGHTDDSYSFALDDRVFSGDTLLIRGTGRTDFQNGDARAQYDSIFNRLLKLRDDTLVYPAHDYKGDTVSTIGEERRCNPRLQVKSVDEYVEIMNNLNLPNPKMMDVAVPANMRIGLAQDAVAQKGWAVLAAEAMNLIGRQDVVLVDLREKSERERHGTIPGALHEPYPKLRDNLGTHGLLRALGTTRRVVFFLRLWRALGHGRPGYARGGHRLCLSHSRRHRGLEGCGRSSRTNKFGGHSMTEFVLDHDIAGNVLPASRSSSECSPTSAQIQSRQPTLFSICATLKRRVSLVNGTPACHVLFPHRVQTVDIGREVREVWFIRQGGSTGEEVPGAIHGKTGRVCEDDEEFHPRAAEERDGCLDEMDGRSQRFHRGGRRAAWKNQTG